MYSNRKTDFILPLQFLLLTAELHCSHEWQLLQQHLRCEHERNGAAVCNVHTTLAEGKALIPAYNLFFLHLLFLWNHLPYATKCITLEKGGMETQVQILFPVIPVLQLRADTLGDQKLQLVTFHNQAPILPRTAQLCGIWKHV